MAAGVLPGPGTTYGPCVDDCGHVDCAVTRHIATTACSVCGEGIGYDRRFYNLGEVLTHARCLEGDA